MTTYTWLRRGFAFAVDLLIVWAVWTLVETYLVAPVGRGVMEVGFYVWFVLYFVIAEGFGAVRASPGKRTRRLTVLDREGRMPSFEMIAIRAAVLGLAFLRWDELIGSVVPDASLLVTSLVQGLAIGILVANIVLAFVRPEGELLHDMVTGTRVAWLDATVAPAPEAVGGRWRWAYALAGIAIGAAAVVGWTAASSAGGIKGLTAASERAVPQRIEDAIAKGAGIRSEVSLNTRTGPLASDPSKIVRALDIKIWIPWSAYDEPTIAKVTEIIKANVNVTPGYFVTGELRVASSIGTRRYVELASSDSKTYKLNMPQ